ncbi:S24 family peptidase [Pseudozobellia sp. WGM2]|uniref:S24 family peptidase n=1 Tax=Pseudozobellia sp. WGM2 TaxID=2787625 RepID=UPI001ADFF212|nr:S24 family peptidase [Pseudozobellia sp. WGM2]
MSDSKVHLIKKTENNYRVKRPTQTGFSSPATHYSEPRIDLNEVLVTNSSATFFIKVADDGFNDFNILKNDVLIVDKSLSARTNQLVVATINDNFSVIRIGKEYISEINIWGVITYIIKSVL